MRDDRFLHLLSPIYYPQYNGSAEAGIGSLQTRAHHEAARGSTAPMDERRHGGCTPESLATD
ncbi:MAG: hypothetical protein AMXMBFR7_52750 [Planctomycetota bacterium]